MAKFDFISDEKFRASLESDYQELNNCLKSKAWKAAHVLGGSMIEAILVDYLIATDFQKRTSKDPLKMSLNDLIKACETEKILSEKTVQLSGAIRSYRNLIHPGRQFRLGETVDENGAIITHALVEIVLDEVCLLKKNTYGYTAEQIVEKVERDSTVVVILGHILKEAKYNELERLLLNVLPKRYFEIRFSGPEYVIQLRLEIYWNVSRIVTVYALVWFLKSKKSKLSNILFRS